MPIAGERPAAADCVEKAEISSSGDLWPCPFFTGQWEGIKQRVSRCCDGAAACIWDLENERGQLIERIDDVQAHENKRYDHQIKAKMMRDLKPTASRSRADLVQGRKVSVGKDERPANSSTAIGTEGPPPPRK
jgi:hypothetical protein